MKKKFIVNGQMRRKLGLLFCIGMCAGMLAGCQRETAEITVPETELQWEEQGVPEIEVSEEEVSLDTSAGTVLGEEEILVLVEGEAQCMQYTRIQGNGDYSLAYDAKQFVLQKSEAELLLESAVFGCDSDTPVFLRVYKENTESAEALAEQFVLESNEECSAEELTVGEGEYPAIWVGFAEGMEADSRTCDWYLLRHNEQLYVVQMVCFLEAQEGLGGTMQTILSTLRFSEG